MELKLGDKVKIAENVITNEREEPLIHAAKQQGIAGRVVRVESLNIRVEFEVEGVTAATVFYARELVKVNPWDKELALSEWLERVLNDEVHLNEKCHRTFEYFLTLDYAGIRRAVDVLRGHYDLDTLTFARVFQIRTVFYWLNYYAENDDSESNIPWMRESIKAFKDTPAYVWIKGYAAINGDPDSDKHITDSLWEWAIPGSTERKEFPLEVKQEGEE